jgi:hypothetical protein
MVDDADQRLHVHLLGQRHRGHLVLELLPPHEGGRPTASSWPTGGPVSYEIVPPHEGRPDAAQRVWSVGWTEETSSEPSGGTVG